MLLWSNWYVAPLNIVHYLIFFLCFIFLILTCVKVWQRYKGKSVFIASALCMVNTFAVIALLILIFPIFQFKAVSQQAIVITNNSDEQLVQKAIEQYKKGDIEQFFVLVNDAQQGEYLQHYFKQEKMLSDVVWLTSSYQLLNSSSYISSDISPDQKYIQKFKDLYVYGDGFTKDQLKSFTNSISGVRLHYYPSNALLGFIDVEWSQEVLLGANASVTGTLQSNDINSIYLVELVDINNDVIVQSSLRANHDFHFDFIPKAPGVNQYYLNIREMKSDQSLVKEVVQLNVILGNKLNVWVKTASPSFEVRHLKNWLAEQGSQLTLISQTSKNANLTQTVNIDKETNAIVDDLSAENLAKVDLLILDGRSVISLSQIQQQQLMTAIKHGLALFVLIDDALVKMNQPNELANFFQTFVSLKNKADVNINKPTGIYYQSDGDTSSNDPLLIPSNINLINKRGDELVINSKQKPLVLSKSFGFGSVTLSAINTSYQWKLSGLNKEYGQYWQYLLGKMTSSQDSLNWLTKTHQPILFPLENTRLCYRTEGGVINVEHRLVSNANIDKEMDSVTSPKTLLFGNKSIDREHQYCVDWLITASGWHKLTLVPNDTSKSMDVDNVVGAETLVYVSEANQWLALQQVSKQRATSEKTIILSNENDGKIIDGSPIDTLNNIKIPLNKWPIWIVFISCCSLLWIERKKA